MRNSVFIVWQMSSGMRLLTAVCDTLNAANYVRDKLKESSEVWITENELTRLKKEPK